MAGELTIRPYGASDERGWIVRRVLSFLDTAFYDDVRQSKKHYEHPAIELVDRDAIQARFARVHENVLYDRRFAV